MKLRTATVIFIGLLASIIISCKSTNNNTAETTQKTKQNNTRGEKPSIAEIISKMDTNNDGKLSKEETKGPLSKDFAKIDTNDDGYLTKDEITKAPKPSGQRPQGVKNN